MPGRKLNSFRKFGEHVSEFLEESITACQYLTGAGLNALSRLSFKDQKRAPNISK